MKKLYLLLILLAAFSFSCSDNDTNVDNQPVEQAPCLYYDGYVRLSTQAQVDSYCHG